MAAGDREERPARLGAHARFVGAWGHLCGAGVAEPVALAALAEATVEPALRELALASARASGGLGPALDAHGGCLDGWLVALLAGARRSPEHLVAAAGLLEREAAGAPPRALLWARLRLVAAAHGPLGDALSSLARAARDAEQAALAEGLLAAAKRARGGAGLIDALRGAAGLGPLERAALEGAREDDVDARLRALEALALLPRDDADAPAAGASSLSNLAQAATAGAAPLRRGLERVLSGIEEALGIGPPDPAPAAQLAREAVQARAAARQESPPSPPAAAAAPPEPGGGKKKTIGMDSGPVPQPGFDPEKRAAGDGARVDARVAAATAAPADPVEAWTRALERARSKLVAAELTPTAEGPGLAREVEAELARLRAAIPGGSRRLTTQLDDLELRLLAWKERHG
ncbi:MAG: hypothetical protein M9894_36490 [Planctomycetes bacterium]|nr:hypothetical protein [Planctomycetota bacterium]